MCSQMARRFRLWEANGAIPVSSCESPARSTAVTSSHSSSFISISETSDRKNVPYAIYDNFVFRKRQLIVAVTANSAECEKANDGGFDEICAKPLTRADIYKVITRNFQYE